MVLEYKTTMEDIMQDYNINIGAVHFTYSSTSCTAVSAVPEAK